MKSIRTARNTRPASPLEPSSLRSLQRQLQSNQVGQLGEFSSLPSQQAQQAPQTCGAIPALRSVRSQGAALSAPSTSRPSVVTPSLQDGFSSRFPEEAFRDLLARESVRDAEVRALRQEVSDLHTLLRSLVRRPHSDDEEEESLTMSSPREIVAVRGLQVNSLAWSSGRNADGPLPHGGAISPWFPSLALASPGADGLDKTYSGLSSMETSDFHELLSDVDVEPPSTMYAYCVFVISSDDRFWSLWETWYLMLMLFCQVFLVFTYNMSEGLKCVNKHMRPFFDESMKEWSCFYAPLVFHHRPIAFIISVICSLVVVMCYLRLLDRGTIHALHPEPQNLMARRLVDLAWFVQAIWLPAMFCGSTSWLLWGAETPQSVVMNSVGLAYLLEADEYMYSAFVPDTHKIRYVEGALSVCRRISAKAATQAESSLFFAAILQCTVMITYLHILNFYEVEGFHYLISLWGASGIFMIFYVVRANMILILQPSEDDDNVFVLSPPGNATWTYSFAGFFLYIVLTLVTAPKTVLTLGWSTHECATQWLEADKTPGLQV